MAEMDQLAARDIDAIADYLAQKPYLMGEVPCGADATVFPFMAHALCPLSATAIRPCAEQKSNLVAYRDRMMQRYFPDFGKAKTAAA
jgi:glutathione S-transferase